MKTISIIRDGKEIALDLQEAICIAEAVREEQAWLLVKHLIDSEDDEQFQEFYGVDKTFITGNEEIMRDLSKRLAYITDELNEDRDEEFWEFLDYAIKEYV